MRVEAELIAETDKFRTYRREFIGEEGGLLIVLRRRDRLMAGVWEPSYTAELILRADGSVLYSEEPPPVARQVVEGGRLWL
jgi:hypothetical protein